MNMLVSRFAAAVLAPLLFAGSASAWADCRSEDISCANGCLLPGAIGIFGKQTTDAPLKQCLARCETKKRSCLLEEAREERRRQAEDASRAQAASLQKEREQAQAHSESQAREQDMAQLRQRYPGRLIFRTDQLLDEATDALQVVATLDAPAYEQALIGDRLFYIDRNGAAQVLNLTNGSSQALEIPGAFGVTQFGEEQNLHAVVKSVRPGERQLTIQVFDRNGQPVSAATDTGMPVFVGSKKGEGDRYFSFHLQDGVLYAWNPMCGYVHGGHDGTPLEMRAFDLRSGMQTAAMSFDSEALAIKFAAGQIRAYSLARDPDVLSAFDFSTQARLFQQPVASGSFGSKDYAWLGVLKEPAQVYVSRRSQDQKREAYAWFDTDTAAPRCTFSTASAWHSELKVFASGHLLFDQQCRQVGEIAEARGGQLYQLEGGWMAWYPEKGYVKRAFDAKGTLRSAEYYNDIVADKQGNLMLFRKNEPARLLDRDGNQRTLSTAVGSYPVLWGNYLRWSGFDNGYRLTVARVEMDSPVTLFLRQQAKDEYETTAAWRQRIAGLRVPFSHAVELGTYDADNQTLPITFKGLTTNVRVPAAQARRLKEQQSAVRFSGQARLAEPGVLEVSAGSLNAGAVEVDLVPVKRATR